MLDCDLLHKKNSERHKLDIVPKVLITKLMSQKQAKNWKQKLNFMIIDTT